MGRLSEMDCYYELRNAIVERACEDLYKVYMGKYINNGNGTYTDPKAVIKEIELFFNSQWFELLSDGKLSADYLIKNVKAKAKEDKAKEEKKEMDKIKASRKIINK